MKSELFRYTTIRTTRIYDPRRGKVAQTRRRELLKCLVETSRAGIIVKAARRDLLYECIMRACEREGNEIEINVARPRRVRPISLRAAIG